MNGQSVRRLGLAGWEWSPPLVTGKSQSAPGNALGGQRQTCKWQPHHDGKSATGLEKGSTALQTGPHPIEGSVHHRQNECCCLLLVANKCYNYKLYRRQTTLDSSWWWWNTSTNLKFQVMSIPSIHNKFTNARVYFALLSYYLVILLHFERWQESG